MGSKLGIGETEHQHVLHRFFAQEVIDAVEVFLIDQTKELAIQGACRGFIIPEWLFDDDAAPSMVAVEERCIGQFLRDFTVEARRCRQVKEDVIRYMPLRLDLDDLLP